jgi:hypothetical protein
VELVPMQPTNPQELGAVWVWVSSSLNRPMTSKAFAPLPLSSGLHPPPDHSFHPPLSPPFFNGNGNGTRERRMEIQ